jgi:hypothetical protein
MQYVVIKSTKVETPSKTIFLKLGDVLNITPKKAEALEQKGVIRRVMQEQLKTSPPDSNSQALISTTIQQIEQFWVSGAIFWLKHSDPGRWEQIQGLEEKINNATKCHDISNLEKHLNTWREEIRVIVQKFLENGKRQKEEELFQ